MIVIKTKLYPRQDQIVLLNDTIHKFNDACNYLARIACESNSVNHKSLRKIVYKKCREDLNLTSQMTEKVICKTLKGIKYKIGVQPIKFSPDSIIYFDNRNCRFVDICTISLGLLSGREKITAVVEKYFRADDTGRGINQIDLVKMDECFCLFVTAKSLSNKLSNRFSLFNEISLGLS